MWSICNGWYAIAPCLYKLLYTVSRREFTLQIDVDSNLVVFLADIQSDHGLIFLSFFLSLSLPPSLQLELALGAFPYGRWTTIFEQLNAVVNGPPPKLPNDGRYSKEIQDFAGAW